MTEKSECQESIENKFNTPAAPTTATFALDYQSCAAGELRPRSDAAGPFEHCFTLRITLQ